MPASALHHGTSKSNSRNDVGAQKAPSTAAPSTTGSATASKKSGAAATPEKKYKCQFCARAFSRSEHRSRHERSHTKERPFKCMKCRSTFVRRDLLLRHDRTVHAHDGGIPLVSEGKRRASTKASASAPSATRVGAANADENGRSTASHSVNASPTSTAHGLGLSNISTDDHSNGTTATNTATTTTTSTTRASSSSPYPMNGRISNIEDATLEDLEASHTTGLVDIETAAMLMTDLHHKATAQLSFQHNNSRPDHHKQHSKSLQQSHMPSFEHRRRQQHSPRALNHPLTQHNHVQQFPSHLEAQPILQAQQYPNAQTQEHRDNLSQTQNRSSRVQSQVKSISQKPNHLLHQSSSQSSHRAFPHRINPFTNASSLNSSTGSVHDPSLVEAPPPSSSTLDGSQNSSNNMAGPAATMMNSNHPYSPDHTTMFDSPNPFVPGATMPLPQMPWDSFMPNPLSYNDNGNLQPSPDPASSAQLPSIERFSSHADALAPSLQQLSNGNAATTSSNHVSRTGTPSGLSPFPFLTGPISPVDYRRSPGPGQPITTPRIPLLQNDQEYRATLDNVRQYDTEGGQYASFQTQSKGELNSCLETYFKLFHHHLPFLHPTSFDPTTVAPPLLYSVLSIGALYIFNQGKAYMFHVGSKILTNMFLQGNDDFSSRKCPLWTMQSTLLNMIFASWSGDPKGLEWTCSIKSLVSNMVAGNRYELNLRTDAREGRLPSHAEWIEDEGSRRTYYAVYIFFGMLTLTYNHTPAISLNEFDTVELPASESLWHLEAPGDEDNWHEHLTAASVMTVREVYDKLYQGETVAYSAFATRVMVNALFLEVWYHKRNFEALQDVVTEYKLRLALDTWEKSLEVCSAETILVQLSAPHKGHPLIFNAMAVYRNTRARLEVDLKSVQEALRYHNSYEVASAMTKARDKVSRSQEMIKVIDECFKCIEIVAMQGIKWVGRTCATNWSIEHPLCGLDLMLILSLWLYRLEHDEEPATEDELSMYNKIRNLFDDEGLDVYASKLSAIVAQSWGCMLDEVVVWGITKLMGESFKLHSQALVGYEDSVDPGSASGHQSGDSAETEAAPSSILGDSIREEAAHGEIDVEASFSSIP